MNWLDIVILVPCVWGLIKGISNGIVKEVMQIVSLVLGIWLSI
ncbi:MAG: CvpA family protein, partial [Bacteroidales bacterium]|nr:CvpA family protein [Bacteroidales bacterium]